MIGVFLSALLALQASGSPSPAQHVHAGVDAEKSGQLDAALAEFQKATELDPKLAVAFADLGGVYIEKRDYAAAIPPLKRAIELSPDLEAAPPLVGIRTSGARVCHRSDSAPREGARRGRARYRSARRGTNCRRPWQFCKKLWRKARMIRSCSITMAGLPACSPNRFLTNSKLASRIPRVPMK